MLFRHRRRPVAWLALVAMLALALLPAVSHALAAAGGGQVEICTAQGPRWVPAGEIEGGLPVGASTLAHCPYCLSAGAGLGPNPAEGTARAVVFAGDAAPPAMAPPPPAAFACCAAPPRAPPAAA
jgi:hypothetical protein